VSRSLQQRLDRCMRTASLSPSDLAQWMDISYHSLRGYLKGVVPHEPRRSQVDERLKWLERAIKDDSRFPVPIGVRQQDRATYIDQILAKYAR
jgi:nicotinic acid mononucleotide adenylyltransferase